MGQFINIIQPFHLDKITELKNNVMAPKPDKSWHAHFHPTVIISPDFYGRRDFCNLTAASSILAITVYISCVSLYTPVMALSAKVIKQIPDWPSSFIHLFFIQAEENGQKNLEDVVFVLPYFSHSFF